MRFFVKGGKPLFKFDLWRVDLSHAQATTPNGLPTRASTREEREERRESWRSESHKASRGRVRFRKEKPPPRTQAGFGGFCFCFFVLFLFFFFFFSLDVFVGILVCGYSDWLWPWMGFPGVSLPIPFQGFRCPEESGGRFHFGVGWSVSIFRTASLVWRWGGVPLHLNRVKSKESEGDLIQGSHPAESTKTEKGYLQLGIHERGFSQNGCFSMVATPLSPFTGKPKERNPYSEKRLVFV